MVLRKEFFDDNHGKWTKQQHQTDVGKIQSLLPCLVNTASTPELAETQFKRDEEPPVFSSQVDHGSETIKGVISSDLPLRRLNH